MSSIRNIRRGIPALTRCQHKLRVCKPPNSRGKGRPYPYLPKTVGDYLRKKRLDLGLFRSDVAKQLGRSIDCIRNWENNWRSPTVRCLPSIVHFIGYCPYDVCQPIGKKVRMWRLYNGVSQEQLAREINVDPGTIAALEKGNIPERKQLPYISKIRRWLNRLITQGGFSRPEDL